MQTVAKRASRGENPRTMHTRIFATVVATALFATGAAFAQETTPPPQTGTIIVDHQSDLEAMGTWTMLQPNQESFKRTDASLTMPNMLPGKYTFLADAPEGTTTHIDLMLGDDVISTADNPQISFDLADKMTLKILVKHSLTIFGKVGVNSEPSGIPFTLRGPDGLVQIGVTPAEYPKFPIGNYSVTFRPGGCPEPPVQAGLLQKDNRVDFMVKVVCSTLKTVEPEHGPENVTTKMGKGTVTFTDVPSDSWFGPYISTIVNRAVMSGYDDKNGEPTGRFGPADPVTIAQLAKIAHTAIRLNENDVPTAPKNPLARGQWFTRYIASAEEQGWLVYLDGTVDPNRPATRGEVVTTLLQVFDVPVHWPKGTAFMDVQKKTPYSGAIETAAQEGIVSGTNGADGKPTGLFHPMDQITRAEIAKILITAYEKYQADAH